MKAIQFTAILIMLVFPWTAALSQQQNSTVAIETEATSDTTNANLSADVNSVATAKSLPERPAETDAERKARLAKISHFQALIDNCNHEFMGLPVAHQLGI